MLHIGSLFSGIGGLERGLEWSGLGPVIWQAEKEPYCQKVLEKHWPGMKRYEDVKEVTGAAERPDLICGGFPCQNLSAAGKGEGLSGSRSGLWAEFYRIVHELEPEWIVVENVSSGALRWVDSVRGSLELIGYETLPVPLSAQSVGAPHLRKRIFIVARAVDTWSKRSWRSGGAFTVSYTDSQEHNDGPFDAEVASAPEPVSNTKRGAIRNRPKRGSGRWARGAQGQRQTVPVHDGGQGSLADASMQHRPQPGFETSESGRCREDLANAYRESQIRTSKSWDQHNPWESEPDVGRVADGVPFRSYRLRALGNAVVPQCAEVIGYIIQELEKGVIK